jgi:cytochrome P450
LSERGTPVAVAAKMMRLTLQIVSLSLFSSTLSKTVERVGPAIRISFAHGNYRMVHLLALPECIRTRRNRQFLQAKRTLDALVYGLIEARRHRGEDRGDLLLMLLLAREDETRRA